MHKTLWTITTILSAFAGGAVSNWLLRGSEAMAQAPQRRDILPMGPMRAGGFILEDRAGRTRGELTIDRRGNAVLRLYSATGALTWSSPSVGVQPLTETR